MFIIAGFLAGVKMNFFVAAEKLAYNARLWYTYKSKKKRYYIRESKDHLWLFPYL